MWSVFGVSSCSRSARALDMAGSIIAPFLVNHLLIPQPEVVPQLVDHRIADLLRRLVAALGDAQDWSSENRDLVRHERGAVHALGEGGAAGDAEELVTGVFEEAAVGGAR